MNPYADNLFHEYEIDGCNKKKECENVVPFDCKSIKGPEAEDHEHRQGDYFLYDFQLNQ